MPFDFKEDYRRDHVLSWLEWPATTNNGPSLVGQNNKSNKIRGERELSACTCRWGWVDNPWFQMKPSIMGQYLMEHTGLVSKVVLTNCFFSPSFRPSRRNVLIHLKDHTVASIPIHTVLVVDSHHGSQPFLARCAMRAMMMKIVKHPTVRTIKSL